MTKVKILYLHHQPPALLSPSFKKRLYPEGYWYWLFSFFHPLTSAKGAGIINILPVETGKVIFLIKLTI